MDSAELYINKTLSRKLCQEQLLQTLRGNLIGKDRVIEKMHDRIGNNTKNSRILHNLASGHSKSSHIEHGIIVSVDSLDLSLK